MATSKVQTDLASLGTNLAFALNWINEAIAAGTSNPSALAADLSCARTWTMTAQTDLAAVNADLAVTTTPPVTTPPVTTPPVTTPPVTTPPTSSAAPFYGTAVNNGWGNVTAGEASAAKLGKSIVMFGDYFASGGYPYATIKAMPFPKFLLTTHLWASSGQYTQASFLAALKKANSPELAGFVQMAKDMASTGKQCIIRLSAEPEGGWEPDNATADPADYSASLDIIIPAMVAAFPALEFTLDFDNGWFNLPGTGTEFNPNNLYSAAVLALPNVKYVGMDTYAEFWGTVGSGQTMSQADWDEILTNQYGLVWLATFAEAHNLQVGISEFGPSLRATVGTGDDPYYINQFFAWFKALGKTAGFVCFFDVEASDGDHEITSGRFPQSLTAAQAAIA